MLAVQCIQSLEHASRQGDAAAMAEEEGPPSARHERPNRWSSCRAGRSDEIDTADLATASTVASLWTAGSMISLPKAQQQTLHQSRALKQHGLTGRWEVPTQVERVRALRMFQRLGIDNIEVKVVPKS